MKNNLLLLLAFFFFPFYSSIGQIAKTKIENFIISEKNDSVFKHLNEISDVNYKGVLKRIALNKASIKDYTRFIYESTFYSKTQYKSLNRFINSRVNTPTNIAKVNLDYVILKSEQINFIANELELKDANKEHEKLKFYLKSISQKNSNEYKRAELYLDLYNTLLKVIKFDKNGLKYTLQNEKKAFQLKDTILALNFRTYALTFFVYNEDLDGYINAARKSLEFEGKLKEKSPKYEETIGSLLDGLIFKPNSDKKEIESLLFQLYNSTKYHYNSLSLYAKYVGHLSPGDPSLQPIFELFKVKNVGEFSFKILDEAKGKVNPNELYYVLGECAMALFYHEDYRNCFYFKNEQLILNKQIYSKELSQTIADYQTAEVQREKEFAVQREKEKNKFYLIILVIVVIFLSISTYLAVAYIRKSNVLKIRNQEKEMLMREIHHRVKNNFELVNSLLELQSFDTQNSDEVSRLNEGQNRIQSMSLIHQKLYQSDTLEAVDFKDYTTQLVELILSSANLPNVEAVINSESVKLDIDTAIPLGLIINELCTNSCKYAFKSIGNFRLEIELKRNSNNEFILTYRDTGLGLEMDKLKNSKGIGMMLINSLSRQLNGKVEMVNDNGFKCIVHFKDKSQRKNTH